MDGVCNFTLANLLFTIILCDQHRHNPSTIRINYDCPSCIIPNLNDTLHLALQFMDNSLRFIHFFRTIGDWFLAFTGLC